MFDNGFMFSGVDGCRYGWLKVSICGAKVRFQIEKEFSTMLNFLSERARVLVDMPIGLLSGGDHFHRPCDIAARKYLGRKHSSVFSPPCLEALYESDYASASAVNDAILGKKLSKQSWNIAKRIREVNAFLHLHPNWRPRVLESHPEMAYMKLNDDRPLLFSKKTSKGIEERLEILSRYLPDAKNIFTAMRLSALLKGKAQPDDMADALGLAVLNYVRKDKLTDISNVSLTDPLGNKMGIWV